LSLAAAAIALAYHAISRFKTQLTVINPIGLVGVLSAPPCIPTCTCSPYNPQNALPSVGWGLLMAPLSIKVYTHRKSEFQKYPGA